MVGKSSVGLFKPLCIIMGLQCSRYQPSNQSDRLGASLFRHRAGFANLEQRTEKSHLATMRIYCCIPRDHRSKRRDTARREAMQPKDVSYVETGGAWLRLLQKLVTFKQQPCTMILLQDMHQKSQGLKSPAVLKTVSAYAAPPLFRPDYCVIEAAAAAITHSLELQ
ncbi:hypothetical protein HBH89_163520 [Parastagonospora nodorum]|nr:hypothetical protein HBH89_163520 [Parastagonospora nodorum]KAH4946435.1 hypothetical protein HBH73_139890 [Parastagonospora nodorum]